MTETWSEWREHDGGGCPVGPDVIVSVKLHNAANYESRAAKDWRWSRFGISSDIVAYRVLVQSRQAAELQAAVEDECSKPAMRNYVSGGGAGAAGYSDVGTAVSGMPGGTVPPAFPIHGWKDHAHSAVVQAAVIIQGNILIEGGGAGTAVNGLPSGAVIPSGGYGGNGTPSPKTLDEIKARATKSSVMWSVNYSVERGAALDEAYEAGRRAECHDCHNLSGLLDTTHREIARLKALLAASAPQAPSDPFQPSQRPAGMQPIPGPASAALINGAIWSIFCAHFAASQAPPSKASKDGDGIARSFRGGVGSGYDR